MLDEKLVLAKERQNAAKGRMVVSLNRTSTTRPFDLLVGGNKDDGPQADVPKSNDYLYVN
jgi:hypothetical protein